MVLVFGDDPKDFDSGIGAVRWFGEDGALYVECRVGVMALTKRCGAEGLANREMMRAFNAHKGRIEKAGRRKYEFGNFVIERDPAEQERRVIVLGVDDL